MDTKKKIEYWLDTTHYDLVSAKAMLASKRFLYMVILYGSYARGHAKKSSDIDVAVVVDKFQGDYLKGRAQSCSTLSVA